MESLDTYGSNVREEPGAANMLGAWDILPPDTYQRSGLTLLLGPPNSGKLGEVLAWWQKRTTYQPLVVVPTSPDAREITLEMLRRNQSGRQAGAILGKEAVLTFDGLMAQVLGESPRYISNFTRDLMLRRILVEMTSSETVGPCTSQRLRRLKPILAYPGSRTAIANLLRSLGESGCSAEAMDELLLRWGEAEPTTFALAADIALLMQRYAQLLLAEGLVERADVVRLATQHLNSWTRPVAFYGFTDFNPGRRIFLEALSKQVPVLLSLAFEKERLLNIVEEEEVAHWQTLAHEVIERPWQSQSYSSPAISYLEKNFASIHKHRQETELGTEDAPNSKGTQGVYFVLASSQRSEAELAAERIGDLLREGFIPEQIGVVVRNVKSWGNLLADVFTSCNIPYRLDKGRELRKTGLGYAFLSVLQTWVKGDDEALLAFLRSPYSGLDAGIVSQIETCYWRGVNRGTDTIIGLLGQKLPKSLEIVRSMSTNEDLSVSGKSHAHGASLTQDKLSAQSVAYPQCDHKLNFLVLQELARELLQNGLRGMVATSRLAEDDMRAYKDISTALSSLSAAGWLSTTEVLSTLEILAALGNITVSKGPVEGQQAVQILSPDRVRARRFDALFILGLVEGEFPAHSQVPILLTEGQRAHLNALGGGGVLPANDDKETALFANTITRPWQVLYLSSRDADDSGSTAIPSQLWTMSKDLLKPLGGVDFRRTLSDQVFPLEQAPTVQHRARSQAVAKRVLTGGVASLVKPTQIQDPVILSELATRNVFSPSELESYLTCPLAWFLEKMVGVEKLETTFDALASGSLLHTALSDTYQKLRSRGLLPLRPSGFAQARTIAFAALDKAAAHNDLPGTVAQKKIAVVSMRRMIAALLYRESESGATLAASELELWIGGYEGVDIGGLRVRGRIDRVDSDPTGEKLFILDYKSGHIPPKNKLGEEEGLQLPLYLLALAAERPQVQIIGGAYYSLKKQSRSGLVTESTADLLGEIVDGCRILDEEDEKQLLALALQTAQIAVQDIRGGFIGLREDGECPPWCGLGPACRLCRGGRWS